MAVQVITDSTCDIPQALAQEVGVKVVPIYVRFGDKTYRDGVDIRTDEFYAMLATSPFHPATSQPNPEDFVGVYKEYCDAADRNCDGDPTPGTAVPTIWYPAADVERGTELKEVVAVSYHTLDAYGFHA